MHAYKNSTSISILLAKANAGSENSILSTHCWNGNPLLWVISLQDNYPINEMVLGRRGVQESWLIFQGSPSPNSAVVHPHVQETTQRWSFSSARHHWVHTWRPVSSLGSPLQGRHGHTGDRTVKGHEYGKETGDFVIQGELSLRKGKLEVRGESCWCTEIPGFGVERRWRQILLNGAQWKDRRQWRQTGIQGIARISCWILLFTYLIYLMYLMRADFPSEMDLEPVCPVHR